MVKCVALGVMQTRGNTNAKGIDTGGVTLATADDHEADTLNLAVVANADWFAQGLSRFLETTIPGVAVVGTTRFDRVDELYAQSWPDLILVGVPTRHDDHVMLLAGVRYKWPNTAVVMLSCDHFPEIVANARIHGATGYITTSCHRADIARALDTTRRGHPFFPDDAPATVATVPQSPPPNAPDDIDTRLARLTRRERQVMEMLGHGYANREIAEALSLREGTVRIYVHRVIRQLGLRNRVDVALCASAIAGGNGGRPRQY